MKKEEFLKRLEMLLSDISEEEREEAMAFYRSYFDDAGEEDEARIIAELESPENVAETIKRDLGMITDTQQGSDNKNKRLAIVIILIAILTFPAWFGVLSGIIGTVIGLSAALIGITFSVFVVGVVFLGLGIAMLAGLGSAVVSVPVGLAFVGSGLLVLALAMLLLLACVAVFGTFFPWAGKGIYNLCKKPFAKKEAQTV